ncbi:hypothetical protein GCM10027290_51630 [Micromonospora sonneratiae]|uniref:SWIM-type domain-containing protein n=1 Tax=Micromonospora sonneratiae TaxID=1184706 RepID=A0ABW3Y9H4_9ACTN
MNRRPQWARAWRDVVLALALDDESAKHARKITRQAGVEAVEIRPGNASAVVRDRGTSYPVRWKMPTLTEGAWDRLGAELLHRPLAVVGLLRENDTSPLEEDLADVLDDLIPSGHLLDASCGCDDWIAPCRHALAVGTAIADVIEADVWKLFELRGRTRNWLIEIDAAARADRLLRDAGYR